MSDPIVDDPTAFPAITSPDDTDVLNGASIATSLQQLADRTAYLNSLLNSGAMLEKFESATFPPPSPSGAWSAPSRRYGSDLGYIRSTSTPLEGSASADRPSGQAASQVASLGLDFYITSPSRVSFFFNLLASNTNGDILSFYIDGSIVAPLQPRGDTIPLSGKWTSDILREGHHTFDWRFTQEGTAVSGAQAKIDHVMITPESLWIADAQNRGLFFDDFPGTGLVTSGPWVTSHGTNAGSVTVQDSSALVTCAASAASDWEALSLAFTTTGQGWAGFEPYIECQFQFPSSLTNLVVEFGLWDNGSLSSGGTPNNYVAAVFDSTVNATKFSLGHDKAGSGAAYSTWFNGPTITNSCHVRIGMQAVGRSNLVDGYAFTIALVNASGDTGGTLFSPDSTMTIGYPVSTIPGFLDVGYTPYFRVGSRTGAGTKFIAIDYFKMLSYRTTTPSS